LHPHGQVRKGSVAMGIRSAAQRLHDIFSSVLYPGIFFLVFLMYGISGVAAEGRILKVGVYENAPKIFVSESGGAAGVFVDVIEYIAESEGWRLEFVPGTWTEGLDRLAAGEIDLMPDVAYTPERARIYSFHKQPVLSSWFQVYARQGSGIRSILDLDGKRISVLDRSVQQEAFTRLADGIGIKYVLMTLPDYKEAFEVVAKGQADAAITNRFYGLTHAGKLGLEDTAVIFHPTNLYFAAPLRAPRGILDAIDRRLEDMKNDSRSVYYHSLKRWLSEEVRFKLPSWVKMIGLVAAVTLSLTLLGLFVLEKRVKARTRELMQLNLEMEERIVARTAELAVEKDKAQAADRIKSAFLATMSHELRTPLNSIIGFTGILLQGLAGPLNEEQRKQMTMVQGSARHLLALINDVLDISKIEAGQLTLSVASFPLRPSIEKTVHLVAPLAEKKGLNLQLDIAPDVETAKTDQRRFEQVLLNLLNNAVKFTEKGHIRIDCRRKDGLYLINVSDTGIGIKPEQMSTLFKPFHQIDTGLTRKYEGTGLGLSICRKIVEMMGGDITVESRWGEGSTFTVRFPGERRNTP